MKRKKKQPTRVVSKFNLSLPVELTNDELLDRGARLAQLNSDIADHQAHAESVKKDLKARESALESDRARIASIVRQKREPREIACERIHDYDAGDQYDLRTDTGEVVNGTVRKLTPDDLQLLVPGFDDVLGAT